MSLKKILALAVIAGTATYFYTTTDNSSVATLPQTDHKPQMATASGEVVATYDGGTVTTGEINEKLAMLSPNNITSKFEDMPTDIQKSMAEGMVINEIIRAKAAESGLYKSDKINKMVTHLRDQLVQKEFLDQKLQSEISDDKLKDHYNVIASKTKDQKEVKFRNLVINDESKAKEAYDKLKKGGDFAKVAATFAPQNKDAAREIGFMRAGTHLPQVEEQLFSKLKVKEISAPFKTEFGWHIVQLTDKRQVNMPPLDEIKTQIEQDLKQQLLQDYVAGVLKNSNFNMTWQPQATDITPSAGESTQKVDVDATVSQLPTASEGAVTEQAGQEVTKQQSKEG